MCRWIEGGPTLSTKTKLASAPISPCEKWIREGWIVCKEHTEQPTTYGAEGRQPAKIETTMPTCQFACRSLYDTIELRETREPFFRKDALSLSSYMSRPCSTESNHP